MPGAAETWARGSAVGNVWITDMQLYVDAKGAIAAMPSRVQLLAEHFGAIVIAISPEPIGVLVATDVPCRRRPSRRRCSGAIQGLIASDDGRIHWICPKCEDQGAIAGWEASPWDARREGALH
jgi:hypothetical protein